MKYDHVIEGEKILLRNIELEDCTGKYVNWLNDTETNRYLESRLFVQTMDKITHFVRDKLESEDNYMFAIIHKEKQEHIGNIKIGPIHPVYKNASVGYLIGEKSYWRGGIASEAVYLVSSRKILFY